MMQFIIVNVSLKKLKMALSLTIMILLLSLIRKVEFIYNFRARNCTRREITRPWRDFGIRANDTSYGEAYIGTSALPGAGILVTIW